MNDGVMIAFLPTDGSWCLQDLPHMTLIYCGTTDELPPTLFNELAKSTISIARMMRPFQLDVMAIETFGDEEKVDVLRLYTTSQLEAAREFVERWDLGEHDFRPHATIGPEGSGRGDLPTSLWFDRVVVAWGEQQLRFNLSM